MPKSKGYASINGARLYYEEAGTGAAIVFLHAFSLDTRMWDDQFGQFAGGFRVVRYDMRGYGKSELPDSVEYSHTGDLAALLDYLAIEQACVIGSSMGGSIAIDFAVTCQHRVTALVAVDALLSGYDWRSQALGQIFRSVLETAKDHNDETAKAVWMASPLFEPTLRLAHAAPRLRQMIVDYSGYHFTHPYNGRPIAPPAIEQLATLRIPTLVMVGELDLPEFHSIADELHHRIAASRKLMLASVGHLPSMEAPNTFNRAVARFLVPP